jgi:pimeloyl-ACP methyl ester carboxylesterase
MSETLKTQLLPLNLKNMKTPEKMPAQAETVDEIKYAVIAHARIAYKIFGQGHPLIMCMGYAGNMDLWGTGLIDSLRQKFQVIVFDYRGMGLSTNSMHFTTIDALGKDVFELLSALQIKKAHVLGWSMGGFVAQSFAIRYPEMVDKLVLYASHCGGAETINPNQEIIDILSNPASSPMEFLGTLFPDDWLSSHPQPWKYLPEAKEPMNPETIGLQYVAVQNWLTPGGGSAKLLQKIDIPVLVISGENDKVVPVANASLLAGLIPGATLITEPDCGHGFMYQLPEVFAKHIDTFL